MAQQLLLQVYAYGLLYLLFTESVSKSMESTDKYQVDNFDCLKRGRGIELGMRMGEFHFLMFRF